MWRATPAAKEILEPQHYPFRGVLPAVLAVVLLFLPSCSSRPVGVDESGSDGGQTPCQDFWDCSLGTQTCGGFPPCVHGVCRPDLEHVWVDCGECTSLDQCVIAEPMSCCFGCPEVISLQELDLRPCWYNRARPPDQIPQECQVDCYHCAACYPQPLGKVCNEARCQASVLGCPGEPEGAVEEVTTAAFAENPESYLGRTLALTGSLFPVEISCNDICPAQGCCQGSLAIDGVIRLGGLVCDLLPQVLGDNYCVDVFYPPHWGSVGVGPLPGDFVKVVGTVSSLGSPPWELPGIRVDSVEMRRPSNIGGHYAFTVTEVVYEGDFCGLPPVTEGDSGHLYLAVAGSAARAYTGAFPCSHGAEYLGEVVGQSGFDVRVPVLCTDCCCDYQIVGDLFGGFLEARYLYFDGQCSIVAELVGERQERDFW